MRWLLAAIVAAYMAFGGRAMAEGRFPELARSGTLAELNHALALNPQGLDTPEPETGFTTLTIAALRGETDLVDALLAHGADTEAADAARMSSVSAIARSCHADPEIVAALLAAGADPDARSGAGLVPAMAALQVLRGDIANQIIEAGANVNTVNEFGDGILNFAIYFRQPQTIARLLQRNVDTSQLAVLFTTDTYYQLGFGSATVEARRRQCAASTQ